MSVFQMRELAAAVDSGGRPYLEGSAGAAPR
jgi:hypothetical protein